MKNNLKKSPLKIKDKDDFNTIQQFGTELQLRKWCIEQALQCHATDTDGPCGSSRTC